MNVVYSSSNAYCECTYISLYSLLENNKNCLEINIYVLSIDITQANKQYLTNLANQYGRSIVIIDAKEQFIAGAKEFHLELLRGSYNTYSRIMLDKWFGNLEKIIVVDSDTLVVDNIEDLWNTNLEGKLIGAVPEIGVYSKNSNIESPEILDNVDIYYNMGIVVVNLNEWKKRNIRSLLLEKINEDKKTNLVADQSIINRYLNDYIVRVDLKYNFYSPFHGTSYRSIKKVFSKKTIFSRGELEEAQANPAIIHYYGQSYERPWFKHSASKYKKIYLCYRSKTIWSKSKKAKWRKQSSFIFAIYDRVCYLLLLFKAYNVCLYFKYVIGQNIKKMLKVKR